jgi:hypothetical protein
LIAAATLAVGVISSQAQVYSQNVVGYYNYVIPAKHYVIAGNQLINGSDASQTNNALSAVLGNGFVSDPNGPPSGSNSVYYSWAGTGYNIYYYYNAADAAAYGTDIAGPGWFDITGTHAPVNFNQGIGAFLYNASSSPITATVVGNVNQGTNTATIPTGYSLLSLFEPLGGVNPATNNIGLPPTMTSDPNGPPTGLNDVYYAWAGTGYNIYYYYNAADAATYGTDIAGPGFFDITGTHMPSSSYPAVGQGFFLLHHGAAITWTNTFIVQ